jgi:hypothetical protein
MRYSVTSHSAASVEVLCIEEAGYAPVTWSRLQYSIEDGAISPDPSSACLRAQVTAFCKSFLDLPHKLSDA